MEFITIKEELAFIKKRNALVREVEEYLLEKSYIKVETDYFEDYDEYVRLNSRKDRKSMVKVQNNKGEVLVLRPDITSNIIKQVLSRVRNEEVVQLYYLDTVFSYNRNGKIKQNRQCGVEVIGDPSIEADIRLITMAITLFKQFDLDLVVEIGNQQFVNRLINLVADSDEVKKELKTLIARKNENELANFIKTLDKKEKYKPLLESLFDVQEDVVSIQSYIKEAEIDQSLLLIVEDMILLQKALKGFNIQYDLSLLSSFDYYTGTIFRGYLKGQKDDSLRGGRYDLEGKDTAALGFSFDISSVINEVINNG